MIALASDCLIFEMSSGECAPFSADMISVEIDDNAVGLFDPEFVKHATSAVFHYFKNELGRQTVSVGEFAGALEKALRGFTSPSKPPEPADAPDLEIPESDLRKIAVESGKGCELFFFPRLRNELRAQLRQSPQTLRFRGLRNCVKQLAGAQRWCPRCRTLHIQIVAFLRDCLTAEVRQNSCTLLVK